jgi:hypothetical protein
MEIKATTLKEGKPVFSPAQAAWELPFHGQIPKVAFESFTNRKMFHMEKSSQKDKTV